MDLPSSNRSTLLDRASVVLVETSEDLNIGSALRACWNMGIRDLRLVKPICGDRDRIAVTAPGLSREAQALVCYDSLAAAVADGGLVLGFTARTRRARRDVWDLEILTEKVNEWPLTGDNRLHLVFGPEYAGLSNEDLDLCHVPVSIATDPTYQSLNLAQAVLLGCYALRKAAGFPAPASRELADDREVTVSDLDGLMTDVVTALEFIEFFKFPGGLRHIESTLRRLFGRARLEARELSMLRGIFTEIVGFARRQGIQDPPR